MSLNVFTPQQRARRTCRRNCPSVPMPRTDGDAVQCQHGRWWVFLLEHDTDPSGTAASRSRSGRWRRATPCEAKMLRRASR